jgi:hypothetical protein
LRQEDWLLITGHATQYPSNDLADIGQFGSARHVSSLWTF